MEQWIRDQNVRHFRSVLRRDLSPEQRAIVETLLKNELAGGGKGGPAEGGQPLSSK